MQDDEAEVPARAAQGAGAGRNPDWTHAGAESCAATAGRGNSEGHALIEQVVEGGNMRRAYRRVVGNKGSAGVDHLTVPELDGWLRMHWPRLAPSCWSTDACARIKRRRVIHRFDSANSVTNSNQRLSFKGWWLGPLDYTASVWRERADRTGAV